METPPIIDITKRSTNREGVLFLLLMQQRFRAISNVARQTWNKQPVVALSLGVAGIALCGAAFLGALFLYDIANHLHVLRETLHQSFYYLFLLLLAGSVPFVSATLLQSEDYTLLFTAPISPRSISAARLLEAAVVNSLQFLVLGAPAICAAGLALGWSPFAWALAPLLIFQFVLLPALLSALGLLLSVAAFGASRIRSAISLLNVIMGVLVCLSFVVESKNLPLQLSAVTSGFAALTPALHRVSIAAHLSPSHWFVQAAIALGSTGSLSKAFSSLLLIFSVNGLLFVLDLILCSQLLSIAALTSETSSSFVSSIRSENRRSLPLLPSWMAAQTGKDIRLITRDSMLLSQLGVPLILFAVPFIVGAQDQSMDIQSALFPFTAGIIGFIVYMQTSILSLSLLGMEGRSYWIMMLAPFQKRALLASKWFVSSLLCTLVGEALSLFSGIVLHAEAIYLGGFLILIILLSSGLCGIGVGISALFPRFVHENPAMRVSPWALIVGFFAASGYAVTVLTLVCAALILGDSDPVHRSLLILAAAILIVILTLFAILLPLELGARRLENYDWNY